MANTYYGIAGDVVWKLRWHPVYPLEKNWYYQPRLIRESEQVWCQGPRGGVQLIKGAYWNYWATYLRQDSEKMKQFVWVKLQAHDLPQT